MRLPLLLACLVGCSESPLFPEVTYDALERVGPLPFFAEEYAAAEACVGMAGDFDRVEWFVADNLQHQGVARNALWLEPHRILIHRGTWELLLGGVQAVRRTIRHEAIHHIIQSEEHGEVFRRCDPEAFP